MRGRARGAALAAWLIVVAPSCTDDGMVGTVVESCEPACGREQECDLLRGTCVECDDEEGCEMADECDDCAETDALCIAMLCRSCTTSAQCTGEERFCRDGRCVELEDAAELDP
jgi:hypothetical protein